MRRLGIVLLSLALIGTGTTAAEALVTDGWGSVKGHVRTYDGSPIASALVSVYDNTGANNEPWVGRTSKTGRFSINLPAGTYRLTASGTGSRYTPALRSAVFTVTAKKATRVNKRLHKAAQVSGRVYDDAGQALEGVEVSIYSDPTDAPSYLGESDVTDSTGAFHIGKLNPGNYYVYYRDAQVTNRRWVAEWYLDAASSPSATIVTVTDGQKATGISAHLTPTG